jgi:RecJ-like exonuclease
LVHINPFLVGEDGATFSAGMLCTELARFINPDENINILQIPAMAGTSDHIDNPSVMKEYFAHAAKKGYNEQLLGDIATVLDFVSSKLRFMEAREYIEVLFGEPMEQQKKLVALMAPYIRNLEKKGLAVAESGAQHQMIKKVHLQTIDIEKNFPRGFYPRPGLCMNLLHDSIQEKKKLTNVITIGLMADAMTMRATEESNFSVPDLIEFLNKKIPQAFVEGGGHKRAGSIKFIPAKRDEVFELVKEFIKIHA